MKISYGSRRALCEVATCIEYGCHRAAPPVDFAEHEKTCRGCAPRPAHDGWRICVPHRDGIAKDAREAAELYDALLMRAGYASGDPTASKVSGTKSRGYDPAVIDAMAGARRAILDTFNAWVAAIAEERGFSWPGHTAHEMAEFIAGSADWLAASAYAAGCVVSLHELAWGPIRGQAYPTGSRVREVKECPHDGCDGTVRAVLRRPDSLQPSQFVCSTDQGHAWPAHLWLTLFADDELRGTLTAIEAASALGTSPDSVRQLLRRGRLKSLDVGDVRTLAVEWSDVA